MGVSPMESVARSNVVDCADHAWHGRTFWKMNGSGNDFIIIDHRDGALSGPGLSAQVRSLCRRKKSIGADGLILVEKSQNVDFRWRFFNADGGEAEMCGNGGRCVARFAYMHKIAGREMAFETAVGLIHATIMDDRRVKLQMPAPHDEEMDYRLTIGQGPAMKLCSINTGVPHVVAFVNDLDEYPVEEVGRSIRYHERYKHQGTNANFVTVSGDQAIKVRTYERGVEGETLSCGTGSVASVLIAARKGMVKSPVDVETRGGEILRIHYHMDGARFAEVFMEGDTSLVYQGTLSPDALLI